MENIINAKKGVRMKKVNIPWKKDDISIRIDDVTVEATINWWSKDYWIEITQPYQNKIAGSHMMFAIPCKFVLSKANKRNKEVAILEDCITKIKNDFQENYKP